MIPIVLIAANFVRENRWALITLLLYVAVFGGAVSFLSDASMEDTLFFLRSVGAYGLAFTGLMAASGINNERRTRRMLAVLSKGIYRSQYLTGLLLGAIFEAAVYCTAIGIIGTLALARRGAASDEVWDLVLVLLPSFLLAGTIALFYSTFLHPLLAAMSAAATLAVMGGIGGVLGGPWTHRLPTYILGSAMVSFGLETWRAPWTAAGWAVIDAVVFWVLATFVFSWRDIAVAVE